jgi:hypothetical protein
MLADAGFPVLALAYFKAKGTPSHLDMIPLEYFDKPIQWLAEHDRVQDGRIVVMGGSKGGELALLLAARDSRLRGVVAYSPSSVVFQGIPKVFWPPRSSWTYEKKPLPFVPYDYSRGVDPKNLLPLYELSLKQANAVKAAEIPVERINGPILLLTGKHDKMWPSAQMCESICQRLRVSKFAHEFEHVAYEDAGHTLSEYYTLGGSTEGNKHARLDSQRRTIEFLRRTAAQLDGASP